MADFAIDPDIHRAKTMPSRFYTDGLNFDLSKDKLFARTWQFAGRTDDCEGLQPFNLLPGFLDEPILLSQGADGIRCLSNVCTHRGKILIEDACNASQIRCGYHGRRFDLEGKFLSMPEFDGVEDFPTEDDNLRRIPMAVGGGFIFVSIDPSEPFSGYTEGVRSHFDSAADQDLKLVSTREYKVDAHWALYCENYLEGFHIPFVHHSLNEIVDYGNYSTETFRYASLQTAYSRPPPSGKLANGSAESGEVAGRYLFIFPNTMFNFYPWGISVNVVRPVTPAKSVVEFYTYVSDESKFGIGAGGDLDGVELEDEAVVESVQRGIRSRFYSHGRYSPTREQGTHHFHRLIAEFMG